MNGQMDEGRDGGMDGCMDEGIFIGGVAIK